LARGLAGLGSVAATAPLVGVIGAGWGELLETCWIAEFGLAVGIAASWGYRYLSARLESVR
jgi:biopolymer transport protein ExbB/TolQ